ncbi:hypothetical protein EIP86_011381 [Pleurotus ostreatoroseus]|nr:hypothetical protein EIP86_011381 [Pleurotus ostreatoroseus]
METTWATYEALRGKGSHDKLSPQEALLFGNKILQMQTASKHRPHEKRDFWKTWGTRLLQLMEDIDGRIPDFRYNFERQNWYRQRGSALALTGQIEEAERIVSFIDDLPISNYEYMSFNIITYNVVIRCMAFYRSPEVTIEFLLRHWDFVGTYLNTRSDIPWSPGAEKRIRLFRWGTWNIAVQVENPLAFLNKLREESYENYRIVGLLMIDALRFNSIPFDALAVMEDLEGHDVFVPMPQRLGVIKALGKEGYYEIANNLFLEVSQESGNDTFERELNELGLWLFARQGDLARTDEYAARLEKRGGITGEEISLLIHVHAVRADPVRAIEVWDEWFAPRARGRYTPNIAHYTNIIQAYSRCGDHTGINTWLEKMVQAGITPDEHVYNVILQCFARRGEVSSVAAILDQMRASKNPPTSRTYATVLAMLAQRKDPAGAEAIYKRAVGEGVVPTSAMVNALMNAHIEAASWAGVVTAFNYLKSVARGRGVGITLSTYNTLLKAYVLACAPFQTVFGFFAKLKEMGMRPDKYTYALVIQSACDAGDMGAAKELFEEMEVRAKDWTTRLRVDDYALTIIMGGFLRLGQKARAKAVYDDMLLRGIQPTSHTYRLILRSYSNAQSAHDLALAEQFLKSVVAADDGSRVGSRSLKAGLEYMYRPLLAAHRSRGDKEHVERLLQNYFDEGGSPTISNLTMLMDLYRRRHNIDGARQIWAQIHQLALQTSDQGTLFQDDKSAPSSSPSSSSDASSSSSSSSPTSSHSPPPKHRRQGNTLAIALSIYIDALSAAGQHTEVPLVWRQLAADGFAFDAHNWNHLVVALVRAGEVERAFEAVERVIIPYRRLEQDISHTQPMDELPESPLATEAGAASSPSSSETETAEDSAATNADHRPTPPPLPLPHPDRRPETVAMHTKAGAHVRPLLNLDDFAHPLRVLHETAPVWNMWRPHGVVLVLLYKVLQHLEGGRRVHPVQGQAAAASSTAQSVAEFEESVRERMPREVLKRVMGRYPRTVRAVLAYREFFETVRRERRSYVRYRRQVRQVQRLRSRGVAERRTRPRPREAGGGVQKKGKPSESSGSSGGSDSSAALGLRAGSPTTHQYPKEKSMDAITVPPEHRKHRVRASSR